MGMFMGNWNSYIWPTLTIIKNTDDFTMIMQMMKSLSSYASLGYGAVVAASLIVMVVPLLLYAILQKYIVEGASLTGIK
jgi:multiple sugar transport system permease protein